MTSSHKLFRSKKYEIEDKDLDLAVPIHSNRGFKKGARKASEIEYTVRSKKGLHHISPKDMQKLRSMGCKGEYIENLLHAVAVLESYSQRTINPAIFEQIKDRYGIGMGTMTSLAAMSNLALSDMGVDLRGLVRFYVRHRKQIGDLDELERFVSWMKSRGECVTGVPSAWRHWRSLNGKRRHKHAKRSHSARKKTVRRTKSRAKKHKSKGKRKSKAKRSRKRRR